MHTFVNYEDFNRTVLFFLHAKLTYFIAISFNGDDSHFCWFFSVMHVILLNTLFYKPALSGLVATNEY